jgi:hypothetical protein
VLEEAFLECLTRGGGFFFSDRTDKILETNDWTKCARQGHRRRKTIERAILSMAPGEDGLGRESLNFLSKSMGQWRFNSYS